MSLTSYRDLIDRHAPPLGLDPDLVEAIVLVESSGRADAFRYEPAFYQRYLKHKPEYAGQIERRISSSYGLMQLMYPTAQQYLRLWHPEELFVPDLSIRVGCMHLAALLARFHGDANKAIQAYNAGPGGVGTTAGLDYLRKVTRQRDLIAQQRAHPGG